MTSEVDPQMADHQALCRWVGREVDRLDLQYEHRLTRAGGFRRVQKGVPPIGGPPKPPIGGGIPPGPGGPPIPLGGGPNGGPRPMKPGGGGPAYQVNHAS
jgi:hypothetical protein